MTCCEIMCACVRACVCVCVCVEGWVGVCGLKHKCILQRFRSEGDLIY